MRPAGGPGLVLRTADGPADPLERTAPAGFFFGGVEAWGRRECEVGVFGATGYAGRELVRLLGRPPERARRLHHRQRRGPPRPRGGPGARGRRLLPRPAPRHLRHLRRAAPGGAAATRWSWTSPATCACPPRRRTRAGTATTIPRPALLGQAPYGLTEVYRDRIRGARAGGQPRLLRDLGAAAAACRCCATGSWTADDVVVDAKSGTTGAGRAPREDLLFSRGGGRLLRLRARPRPPPRGRDGGGRCSEDRARRSR